MPQVPDYDRLATEAGGTRTPTASPPAGLDYDQLAIEAGGALRAEADDVDRLAATLGGTVEPEPRAPTWAETAGTTALRVGPAVAGGMLGSLAGPVGTAAGGAAGAALGETLAELYESSAGIAPFSPANIAAQTAIGAIPGGRIIGPVVKRAAPALTRAAGPLLKSAAQAAAEGTFQGAAGMAAEAPLRYGRAPSLGELATAGSVGAVTGGALGAGAQALPRAAGGRSIIEAELQPRATRTLQTAPGAAELRLRQQIDDVRELPVLRVEHQQPGGPAGDLEAATTTAVPPGTGASRVEKLRRRTIIDVPTPISERAHGAPIPDPMKGIEPFLEKFPEEMRSGIRDVLGKNQGFSEQRRGVMSRELTDALARQIDVDASQTLPRGTALNAETLRAYANATATTQQQVRRLAAKVQQVDATDADRLALAAAQAEHQVVLASLMGARAEAGRALASFNMFAKALDSGDAPLIRAALDASGGARTIDDLAAQLAQLPDDPLARYHFLKAQTRPTLGDRARSYYYANILSGIKTHERNFLGNAFNSLANLAVTPAAAVADVARARLTGQPRTVFARELRPQVVGAALGAQRGVRDFLFTLQHGISPGSLTGVERGISRGQFDLPRVELPGGGANPLNYPGRLLDATDALFRSIARNSEYYGAAYAQARREGVKGEALQDRIAELRAGGRANDPTDAALAQKLDTSADEYARRAVFQEPGGAITKAVQGLQRIPGGAFVLPFVKTPANILRQGLEFSPAGAAMRGARAGGRAGAQAQGRALAGSLALVPIALWAAQGKLSGSGPQDPAERASLMESGWRPNSIRIGDQWVSYQLFQPLSVPLSIVANLAESWRATGKTPTEAAINAALRTVRSTLDQSFLSGLFDLQQALENPDRAGAAWAARLAGSAVPFAGALRNVQQATDPTVRQPKGFAESVAAQFPFTSPSVPARVSRFGEAVEREGGPLRRAIDPFNVSSAGADAVAQELQRIGYKLALPSERLTLPSSAKATREQEQRIKQERGRRVRQMLDTLMASPAYRALSDEMKYRAVDRLVDRARRQATGTLRRELIEEPREPEF